MSNKLPGLGICTHFGRRDQGWKAEHLVPLAKEMGVSLVRDEIEWHSVEKEKGKYEISQANHDWLKKVSDAGMGINFVLLYGNSIYENPLDPKAFANFAKFMAEELVGKYNIVSFEIWNEPTNFQFLKQYGGPWSGKEPCLWLEKFAELVAGTASVLKKTVPQIPLIAAPGDPQFFHMAMRYPESLKDIDAVASHPYPSRFPPETVPWGGLQIHERDGISVADDDHSYFSLWRRTQEQCRKYLGRELALHATEWGYSTYDHHRKGHNMAGYSESAQAMYLARGIILTMAAGVESIYLYDFMDDGMNRYELEDNFGMVRHEARCYEKKPSWHTLRRLSEMLSPEWSKVASPPAKLNVEINPLPYNSDLWQHPVKEPYLCINAPQFHWFKVGRDMVSFVWRGGRISGEYRDPVGCIEWDNAPDFRRIEMFDLYSGQMLPVNPLVEKGKLILPEVPVGGSPAAIRWMPT
ncbi:MAG TPA: hypothetical protein DET40_22520 [Lentisphaeria bacterium]|nr:MAG: hypothetical protein A2X45_17250 [Lentisphaerae bacterium GWF2_50_93]HCE46330.1 hypothetical protein [Lentisphaeria bacterium]